MVAIGLIPVIFLFAHAYLSDKGKNAFTQSLAQ
jgi:hypothetical protein